MTKHKQNTSQLALDTYIRPVVLLALFYLYVWLFIEPCLIYHRFGRFVHYPAFMKDWFFLKELLVYPGWLAEYTAGFLSQFYYFSWLGAAIITVVVWAICLCTNKLMHLAGAVHSKIIAYIPAMLLLILYGRYYHELTFVIALLITLLFSIVFEKINLDSLAKPLVLFPVMFIILYYLVGGASLIFPALIIIYEVFIRKRFKTTLLYIIFAVTLPWLLGTYLFVLKTTDTYLYLLPFYSIAREPEIEQWVRKYLVAIFLFFPCHDISYGGLL